MNEIQSNIIIVNCSAFQNSDGFIDNKFHRIINVEQDDTISITSYPNENKSEHSLIIINSNSSEMNVEFNNICSYTLEDLSNIEFDNIPSVTTDPNKNEPEKQNFIFQLNSSETNYGSNGIDSNIHQDFDNIEHGKTTYFSTDSNKAVLEKQIYSFKPERFEFGDKLYECEMCVKTFFDSTSLAKHAKTHCDSIPLVGDSLCKCKICGKSFFDSLSLDRHTRFHYNETWL